MITNDILIYSQIRALPSRHKRVFFWQQIGVGAETHRQTLCEERPLIGGLHRITHSDMSKCQGRGKEILQLSVCFQGSRIIQPTKSTKQDSMGSQRLKANKESVWVYTRSSAHMLWLLTWDFCETPDSGNQYMSDFFVCSWNSNAPITLSWVSLIYGSLP